jgi:hypothetical protein
MDNAKPKITIFDCANNTIEERDMTEEEIANLPKPETFLTTTEEQP